MFKVKIMSMVITARDGKMSISIGLISVVYNRWRGYTDVLYNLNMKMKS